MAPFSLNDDGAKQPKETTTVTAELEPDAASGDSAADAVGSNGSSDPNDPVATSMDDAVAQAWQPKEEEPVSDELVQQAEENVTTIIVGDFDSPDFQRTVLKPLELFGRAEIAQSATKNKLVSTLMVDLSRGGEDAGDIGDKLSQLHLQIKDLDPGPLDFAKRGFLGKFFNPVRKYFAKYQSADTAISDIVKSLDRGAKTLTNDNTTLQIEEKNLVKLTEKLTKDAQLGSLMDAQLEQQIQKAELEGGDPERIQFVREEILFPLRQRVMDMQQMIVVNQQAIVSMNIIRRNNKELLRGVDRAKNVTVTALRTGVMVASALYNQKVVIEKIQTLNAATENIIGSTSRMLREQGSEIQRQASGSTISVDVLKRAFSDALAALEDISKYRIEALPQMQRTVEEFRALAEEGEEVVSRLQREGE
ncbi:MAG: toxic anion resistance protein [Actinomycetes bacterium]|jgi:uncharacterized protein YaaN involved in tellurite resistance|nr:toxic anion resistance protein [Actinomycetes bacterium]